MMMKSGLIACVAIGVAAAGGMGQSVAEQELERSQDRGIEARLEGARTGAPLVHQEGLGALPSSAGGEVGEAAAGASAEGSHRSGMSWARLAHRVGGALVGSWLGYVGAQVVQSDWGKEENGDFRSQRSMWAVVGALAGVVGSHVVGRTEAPVMVPDRLDHFAREQREITTEELREAGNQTAYDVVQRLRPRWLVTRGTHSLSEAPRGWGAGRQVVIIPGNDKIKVYLDAVRLGGVAEMRKVASDGLTSIRFLNPRDATLRYGTGHTHGAILLSAVVAAP
jgi:hypothetical protein